MNGNRNRYSSTPLVGMTNKKRAQKADFADKGGQSGTEKGSARDLWLVVVILVVLPILFLLSFLVPDGVKNIFKIIFLGTGALTLAIMCIGRAFTKNARYSMSLIIAALLVICGVSLAVSMRGSFPRTNTSSGKTIDYFAGSSALESVNAQNGDETGKEATPMGDAAASAAQLQLMSFMNYWGEEQWEQMVSLCLPSWVNQQEEPRIQLFFKIANRKPISYTIDSISGSSADDSRTITITVLIGKTNAANPEYYKMQVLMIRVNNNWYVDPNSLSGTKVTTTAAPDGSVAQVTTVPTAVPTAEPPVSADTVVYYNPSGGKYYHASPNCSQVGTQYLPMTEFYWRDLNSSQFKSLLPCPHCHAPSRPSITE